MLLPSLGGSPSTSVLCNVEDMSDGVSSPCGLNANGEVCAVVVEILVLMVRMGGVPSLPIDLDLVPMHSTHLQSSLLVMST